MRIDHCRVVHVFGPDRKTQGKFAFPHRWTIQQCAMEAAASLQVMDVRSFRDRNRTFTLANYVTGKQPIDYHLFAMTLMEEHQYILWELPRLEPTEENPDPASEWQG